MQPEELAAIDSWIRRRPEPPPTRAEALRTLARIGLAADKAQVAQSRQDTRDAIAADHAQARADYEKARDDEARKTERLRAVRLAKEEHDRRMAAEAPAKKPSKPKRAPASDR